MIDADVKVLQRQRCPCNIFILLIHSKCQFSWRCGHLWIGFSLCSYNMAWNISCRAHQPANDLNQTLIAWLMRWFKIQHTDSVNQEVPLMFYHSLQTDLSRWSPHTHGEFQTTWPWWNFVNGAVVTIFRARANSELFEISVSLCYGILTCCAYTTMQLFISQMFLFKTIQTRPHNNRLGQGTSWWDVTRQCLVLTIL